MKTFTPTLSPSVSFHPPHNIFIHFFVSPSSFFMQIHANGIILVFPLKVISKSEHRARLYSSSLFFLFYSCILLRAWSTRVYLISPRFQSFGLSFNLSLLQTMHISSSVLCIRESVRKITEADCQAKGIFVILIDITKLLSMGVVMIYSPTTNVWTYLFSHNFSCKRCVKITVLFILDALCQPLIVLMS